MLLCCTVSTLNPIAANQTQTDTESLLKIGYSFQAAKFMRDVLPSRFTDLNC
jgi:hypothetical protein